MRWTPTLVIVMRAGQVRDTTLATEPGIAKAGEGHGAEPAANMGQRKRSRAYDECMRRNGRDIFLFGKTAPEWFFSNTTLFIHLGGLYTITNIIRWIQVRLDIEPAWLVTVRLVITRLVNMLARFGLLYKRASRLAWLGSLASSS
jgi:hypothetical protein